jgi:hypothetical protein
VLERIDREHIKNKLIKARPKAEAQGRDEGQNQEEVEPSRPKINFQQVDQQKEIILLKCPNKRLRRRCAHCVS